jgi:hypothetical protein
MQPRIYTYKITFEEIPDWYWGVHKEKEYGEPYLGSPETHKWKWEFYTPHLQICEVFPYTDEGWAQARRVEDSCIRPDLDNSLCLNENVGGSFSLGAARRGGKRMCEIVHAEKDDLGRSVQAVKAATAAHKDKDDLGRSVNAMKAHKEKDDLGRSVTAVKGATATNAEKDDLGRSVQGVKNAEKMHKEKDDLGRSVNAVKAAAITNSQKWKDPLHPELGEHSPGPLALIQKSKGYPHGKENRVRAG